LLDRERNQVLFLAAGALLIVLAAVFAAAQPPGLADQRCPPTALGDAGYLRRGDEARLWTIYTAPNREQDTLREISRAAPAIVVATVAALQPGEWNLEDNKPDELDPNAQPGASPLWFNRGNYIYVDVELAVERYLKGEGPDRRLLRIDGGANGDWRMVVGYEPAYAPGERVLAFLRREDRYFIGPLARDHAASFGHRGKFTLEGDRAVGCDGTPVPFAELEGSILAWSR
jgi:hypothetical protein